MSTFEDFILAEMPLRQVLLFEQGDPRLSGFLATIGTYYIDTTDNYKRYEKIGDDDTDWQPVGTGSTSSTDISALSASLSAHADEAAASISTINTNISAISARMIEFEISSNLPDLLEEITLSLSTDTENLSGTPVSCFDTRIYRAAKYVVSAHNYNNYCTFELLLTYFNTANQGRGVTHVGYGFLGDTSLLSSNSCLIGNDAILTFTPTESDVTVNVQRSLVSEQFPTIAYCGTSNIPGGRSDLITIYGPGGVYKQYNGENGLSVQTTLGNAQIAVDDIVLNGVPWHFNIELDGTVIALITIPAYSEEELEFCKVYVKLGDILYAGIPNITSGSVVLEQLNHPAPACDFPTPTPSATTPVITPTPTYTPTPTPTPTDHAIICDECVTPTPTPTFTPTPTPTTTFTPTPTPTTTFTPTPTPTPTDHAIICDECVTPTPTFTPTPTPTSTPTFTPTPTPTTTFTPTPTPTPTDHAIICDECVTPTPTPTPTPTDHAIICDPCVTPTPTPTDLAIPCDPCTT